MIAPTTEWGAHPLGLAPAGRRQLSKWGCRCRTARTRWDPSRPAGRPRRRRSPGCPPARSGRAGGYPRTGVAPAPGRSGAPRASTTRSPRPGRGTPGRTRSPRTAAAAAPAPGRSSARPTHRSGSGPPPARWRPSAPPRCRARPGCTSTAASGCSWMGCTAARAAHRPGGTRRSRRSPAGHSGCTPPAPPWPCPPASDAPIAAPAACRGSRSTVAALPGPTCRLAPSAAPGVVAQAGLTTVCVGQRSQPLPRVLQMYELVSCASTFARLGRHCPSAHRLCPPSRSTDSWLSRDLCAYATRNTARPPKCFRGTGGIALLRWVLVIGKVACSRCKLDKPLGEMYQLPIHEVADQPWDSGKLEGVLPKQIPGCRVGEVQDFDWI